MIRPNHQPRIAARFARGLARIPATLALLAAVTTADAATTRGLFDRPPFYHGRAAAMSGRVAHLPLTFRDEAGSLDPTPARSPALAALVDSLRLELDRIGASEPLETGEGPLANAPTIRFGARRGGLAADGTLLAPTEVDARSPRRMTFEVEGPGRAWKERVGRAAGDSVGAVLVIQLGFGDQWVRQIDWKGNKSIEIGARRRIPVEWLTSLDDPVQVLHLTGAMLSPAGKVLRVGAEGVAVRRTGMMASSLGAQEVLTEDDLAAIAKTAENGQPVWRAALRDLVRGLLEQSEE